MGRAFGLVAELIDFGSLIWRASGPDDCASTESQTKKSKKERQALRRGFITTSFLIRIGQAFRLDSQAGTLYTSASFSVNRSGLVREEDADCRQSHDVACRMPELARLETV